jgi:aminoglycoside phosphotransferase (APT) family kinase protein
MSDLPSAVDRDALAARLRATLDVGSVAVERIADGLNLVLGVSTPDCEYVLRSPRKLRAASYMNDLRTEYVVLERLAASDVAVPEPVAFCADESVLGEPFSVMTRVDGDVVPLGEPLPERFQYTDARRRFANAIVDELATIHDVALTGDVADGPPAADPTLGDVLDRVSPVEHVERSADRVANATAITGHDVPALDRVADWLRDHAPREYDETLVHGDYRPGNVLLAPGDRPRVAAVLDWETAMLGDPLTELGYLLLRWRDPGDPTPAVDAIARRHPDATDAIEHLDRVNDRGFAPYATAPGSPTRRDLVDRYAAQSGRDVANLQFYVALAAFDLATVWSDLHRHAIEADDESDHAPHVEYVAAVAELVADGDLAV